jgi:hypothetical protein
VRGPTAPTPRDQFCEYTTENRPDAAGNGPDTFSPTHQETPLSVEITLAKTASAETASTETAIRHCGQTHLILNMSLIQTCTSRIKPPPAIPWKALPMISASIVFAVAHTAELAKN